MIIKKLGFGLIADMFGDFLLIVKSFKMSVTPPTLLPVHHLHLFNFLFSTASSHSYESF